MILYNYKYILKFNISNLGPRLGGAAGAQPPLGPHPTPIPAHPQIRCRAFLGPSARFC